jgi:hypothetical protein
MRAVILPGTNVGPTSWITSKRGDSKLASHSIAVDDLTAKIVKRASVDEWHGMYGIVDSTMPTNIEIKAVLTNMAAAEGVAARLSNAGPEIIHQEDHFFHCKNARLKLRVLGLDRGELIRYERADIADLRCSRYLIARTPDPQNLLEILTAAL